MSEAEEPKRAVRLPERMQSEQQALGIVLSLVSRSLAILVIAIAVYVIYLTW